MTARRALLLIDFQRDFLREDGRMPVARNQVAPVLEAARRAVAEARAKGDAIIAIGNEFRPSDRIANLFRKHAAMAGSAGARWDERLPVEGARYFPKWQGSAFCNPDLGRFLEGEGIDEVALAGLYASACVTATARAALGRGLKVEILADAIADRGDAAREQALRRLEKRGAAVIRRTHAPA